MTPAVEAMACRVAAVWLRRIPGATMATILVAIRQSAAGIEPVTPREVKQLRTRMEQRARLLQAEALAAGRRFKAGPDIHGKPPASLSIKASQPPVTPVTSVIVPDAEVTGDPPRPRTYRQLQELREKLSGGKFDWNGLSAN